MTDQPTLDAFRAIALQAGLKLDEAETARMHEGYLGLRTLLARLPQESAMADEPAVVYLAPGMRISL